LSHLLHFGAPFHLFRQLECHTRQRRAQQAGIGGWQQAARHRLFDVFPQFGKANQHLW